MPVNKSYILPLSLFFILALSSCEKRLDQEEPIDALIKPADALEEITEEIIPEDQTLTSEPNEELVELDSLNRKALDLSSENDELEKKIRALTQEFHELKKALLDKINRIEGNQ